METILLLLPMRLRVAVAHNLPPLLVQLPEELVHISMLYIVQQIMEQAIMFLMEKEIKCMLSLIGMVLERTD